MIPPRPFQLSRLPRIHFGTGQIQALPALVAAQGSRLLLITSRTAFPASPHFQALLDGLRAAGLHWHHETVSGEPSPATVDALVARYHGMGLELVVGIGGGSVLDAAKAVAGLLPSGDSVMDYLEGVGRGRPYQGPALPFIAVPTTAGTGSEATKNAVLSVIGPEGFKKSFRDERLVPVDAVVDPALLATCPKPLLAANALDALTQLIESYVSSRAHAVSDALARDGIARLGQGLFPALEDNSQAAAGRTALAYGALLSGITLAQAGLGAVHGLASPLGAFFPIPHGVVCGRLLAPCTAVNLQALRDRAPDHPALGKYADVARLLSGRDHPDPGAATNALVKLLEDWTRRVSLPRLGDFRLRSADFPKIIAHSRGSSMKTNPVVLTDAELHQALEQAL
ncbi:MAG TPA: iron-containing alcohol dehydrogenase [Gammaproteobacteria bacterium]|nr:iron-containing alcohol dehydrogenase [Gammaproteobacteria bacterium]